MASSTPLPYTASPLRLAWEDTILFCKITFVWPITAGLLSIALPFWPLRSGPLDELYPSAANIWTIILHIVLIILQTIFLLSLAPLAFCGIPGAIYFAYVCGFILFNRVLSGLINGRQQQYMSSIDLSRYPSHDDERWIFINGVAVGEHWLKGNLDRLALTFRRPIYGIQNFTRGILFDVIECAIQRGLSYATTDIRNGYAEISAVLASDQIKKVVLILHSQGAIEGGMILDWLYATLPNSQIAKLEVFTFGNASNHWNNPKADDDVAARGPDRGNPDDLRVIKHIEHYANSGDWVSRFGILHFRSKRVAVNSIVPDAPPNSTADNRFCGKLFKREGSGHQLNGNYLDNMFEMDERMTQVLETNEFMESSVDIEEILGGTPRGEKGHGAPGAARQSVKSLSRLWKYRNGMSPAD